MHKLNLIHLDIKPANISFSPKFKKWIFLDFGLSKFIKDNFYQETLISYSGTYEFSSPQMKKTLTSDNSVNLYYNDVYGL